MSRHPKKKIATKSQVLQFFVFRKAVMQLLFLKAGRALFQMREKCMETKSGLEEVFEPCKDLQYLQGGHSNSQQ